MERRESKVADCSRKYVECMTEKEAADLLGDGWTVDVIAHIFNGLI